jgi:hypothetical protein
MFEVPLRSETERVPQRSSLRRSRVEPQRLNREGLGSPPAPTLQFFVSFRYLIRCGRSASFPSRFFLSASYSL